MKPDTSRSTTAFSFVMLAMVSVAQAQKTTTKLFLPFFGYNEVSWSGSVIGACSDSTTYALRCSGTPTLPIPPSLAVAASAAVAVITSAAGEMCDANKPPYIVTEGPSGFYQAGETTSSGVTGMSSYSCEIDGTTSASCTGTASAKKDGVTVTDAPTTAYTGGQFPMADVTITAGVQKLAKATDNVCKSGAADKSIPVLFHAVAFVLGFCGVFVL